MMLGAMVSMVFAFGLGVGAAEPEAAKWDGRLAFDACTRGMYVRTASGAQVPFRRAEHFVPARRPVSLSVRFPRLFASHKVEVEALQVADAVLEVRGGEVSALSVGPPDVGPETRSAMAIRALEVTRRSLDDVFVAFLKRETATELILDLEEDRQVVIEGTRMFLADARALHRSVELILGPSPRTVERSEVRKVNGTEATETGALVPSRLVASNGVRELRSAFDRLAKKVSGYPGLGTDPCHVATEEGAGTVADLSEQEDGGGRPSGRAAPGGRRTVEGSEVGDVSAQDAEEGKEASVGDSSDVMTVRVADSARVRTIEEWVTKTDELVRVYRRIESRLTAEGIGRRLAAVTESFGALDGLMSTFERNLRTLSLAAEVVRGATQTVGEQFDFVDEILQERWVYEFDRMVTEAYGEVREAEELRARAGRFAGALEGDERSHLGWLRGEFLARLRETVQRGQGAVGVGAEECLECGGSASPDSRRGKGETDALQRLEARIRGADKAIERARAFVLPAPEGSSVRVAVRRAVAAVEGVRVAMDEDLAKLNEVAFRTMDSVNRLLRWERGEEIEMSLGVYNENAVVTYRIYERNDFEPYSVVPMLSGIQRVGLGVVAEGGGASDSEETPAEGREEWILVKEGQFEVHRTYRVTAFGAVAWVRGAKKYGIVEVPVEGEDPARVAVEEGGSMSVAFGGKVYFRERDAFPGAPADWLQRLGFFVGFPVARPLGIVGGLTIEPYSGVDVLLGRQWAAVGDLHGGIVVGETSLGSIGAVRQKYEGNWLMGVSFDANIFARLFGRVSSIGF